MHPRRKTEPLNSSISPLQRFVLVDRDGVINRLANGWVTRWEDFQFLPRALEALRALRERQYKTVVVSNQSGVGRGHLSQKRLDRITARFRKEIERHGGKIEEVYYCIHRPEDGCECRKPRPGLLLEAQKKYGFHFERTFLIGDSEVDWQAGRAIGCPVILVRGRDGPKEFVGGLQPEIWVQDLYEAVQYVLSHSEGRNPKNEA